MLIFRNPIQRLQIAQTAFTLFYIRLQHIALATLLFVAADPFLKLGFDEFGEAALKQIFAQCRLELGRQFGIARQVAHLQQGRADCKILTPQTQTIFNIAGGVAHFQLEIPKHVKTRFNHAFDPACAFPWGQKQKINIRERGHLATPVATNRQDRHPLPLGRGRIGVQACRGDAQHLLHQPIGQMHIGSRHTACGQGVFRKGCINGRSTLCLGILQDRHHRRTNFGRIAEIRNHVINCGRHGLCIKNIFSGTNQLPR